MEDFQTLKSEHIIFNLFDVIKGKIQNLQLRISLAVESASFERFNFVILEVKFLQLVHFVERVERNSSDMIVTEVQCPEGCQGLEGGVGQVVGVEGVGHLEVEERLPDLAEGVHLDPGDLVAGQVEPGHAGHVVERVAPDDLDVGVDQVELLHPGREVLELTESEVAVVPGGGQPHPAKAPHDALNDSLVTAFMTASDSLPSHAWGCTSCGPPPPPGAPGCT